jgi:hypothetical protein
MASKYKFVGLWTRADRLQSTTSFSESSKFPVYLFVTVLTFSGSSSVTRLSTPVERVFLTEPPLLSYTLPRSSYRLRVLRKACQCREKCISHAIAVCCRCLSSVWRKSLLFLLPLVRAYFWVDPLCPLCICQFFPHTVLGFFVLRVQTEGFQGVLAHNHLHQTFRDATGLIKSSAAVYSTTPYTVNSHVTFFSATEGWQQEAQAMARERQEDRHIS